MSAITRARSVAFVGITVAALLMATAVVVAGSPSPSEFPVSRAPGLTTTMTASDITSATAGEFKVMADLVGGAPAKITSAQALAAKDIRTAIPGFAIEEGAGVNPDRVLWVVTASGTFATNRGRQDHPLVFGSGALVVDDATGEVVGVSMP